MTTELFGIKMNKEPFQHQITALEKSKTKAKFAYFCEMGSGKTKMMIDDAAIMYNNGHIQALLVLAPKAVYSNWTNNEIPEHMSPSVSYAMNQWISSSSKFHTKQTEEFVVKKHEGRLSIFIVNIEAINFPKCLTAVSKFIATHKGNVMIALDESTVIKNHEAKRTKKAVKLAEMCKIKRIATGSPVTNSPLDLYSQCSFLGKDCLGYGSFYAFRGTYAIMRSMEVGGGRVIQVVDGYKNLDHLAKKLETFSFRIKKSECMDLPEKIYQVRDVPLTPEQIHLYNDMAQEAIATYNGSEMSASIVLTKLLRLHQIICGCFKDDLGKHHIIPNNRIKVLEDLLDECQGKVIIFANYIANIEEINNLIRGKYGDESLVNYYGAIPLLERDNAIKRFQRLEDPARFFVGNTQTAGKGITLTAASNVIYYSNDYSLENRLQSEDRAHRAGQKNNVTYTDLVSKGTVDFKILQALTNKMDIASEIMKDGIQKWIDLTVIS